MPNTFDPQAIEKALYDKWERSKYFEPKNDASSDSFCIVIPPPNVTGSLHMGHAFQHTLIDILTRYARMQGHNTLWQMGTDHAGIATQLLVANKLSQQNLHYKDLGRETFLQHVWDWKERSAGNITSQMRCLGTSISWESNRFTMDESYSKAVLKAFIQLYDDGLIYRGSRLVNWDPELKTALSDLEVKNDEEVGELVYIRYPIDDPSESHITVATTRPETLFGDVAVAVHPDDTRYTHLIGKNILLPLSNRPIPIIADSHVEAEFGTGAVKITPAHDFNDYAMAQRHTLPLINIFTPSAHLVESQYVPETFHALDRFEARKLVIQQLKQLDLLAKIEEHTLSIPRGDRSGVILEPYLTDQWFVKVAPLAETAVSAVKSDQITFVPKHFENTFFAWMDRIQDWCISRQLWWGHQIPAWYSEDGSIYVGESEEEVRSKYNLSSSTKLERDSDVLETWFSSSLWTFASLGWPDNLQRFHQFHPTSVLVTGHDIIFFWVARMMMMTLYLTKQVPFHKVYVHGLVRDAHGQKMSKSKGNGLDPLDLIDGVSLETLLEKRTDSLMQASMKDRIVKQTKEEFPAGIKAYGTDALRFTFCAQAGYGRDVRFDAKRIEGYRNFCNKLWNVGNFIKQYLPEDYVHAPPKEITVLHRWMYSVLNKIIDQSHQHLDTFRFDLFALQLYEFVWHEFCDWYIELAKPLLWTEEEDKSALHFHLLQSFRIILKLLHPVIPYVTEALYQDLSYSDKENPLILSPYPTSMPSCNDPEAESEIQWIKSIVLAIRNIRGELNISLAQKLRVILRGAEELDQTYLDNHRSWLLRLAKLSDISIDDTTSQNTSSLESIKVLDNLKVCVQLEDIINVNDELERMEKDLRKNQDFLNSLQSKLSNESFVNNAPKQIVTETHTKFTSTQQTISKLQDEINRLKTYL